MKTDKSYAIGFDAKRAFLNKSGLGNYSRHIISHLKKYYPENAYYLFSPSSNTNLFTDKNLYNNVNPVGFYKLFKSLWRSYGITKHINKLGLDLYHGLSNELPLNITKSKVKKAVTIHDLIFLKHPELYKKADRFIYHKKTKEACTVADLIIAISTQTKQDIIDFYNIKEERIAVHYQSCDSAFYSKSSVEEKERLRQKYQLPASFILNVGTIEARKNALSILKAIHLHHIDMPLVIVGRATPYLDTLKKYASKHKLKNRLITIHNVPNKDLPTLYQSAEVFVYPSIYEGFGIPVLEAFSSGVPVITTDTGSTAELASDAALLVPYNQVDAIGAALKKIIDDSHTAETLRNKGYKRAGAFTDLAVTQKLIALYHKVL